MIELAKLTWPEASRVLDARTVAILPIGCIEPHGPHLPLDTDVTIAVAQSRRAAEKLDRLNVQSLLLPPLAHGLVNFADCFKGYLCLRPGTLWALLEDVVVSLEEQGIERIVFSNGHLEPAHVEVLRGVILDHQIHGKAKAQVIFPDNTRRRWAETLGEEFKSGDCHAGRYESSLVLAADSDNVRRAELARLPELKIGLLAKLKEGARSFHAAGAERGYCGDPAAASAEEGRELVERLADMLVTSIREAWPELFA
jgi:creatinine amidohydrolase